MFLERFRINYTHVLTWRANLLVSRKVKPGLWVHTHQHKRAEKGKTELYISEQLGFKIGMNLRQLSHKRALKELLAKVNLKALAKKRVGKKESLKSSVPQNFWRF